MNFNELLYDNDYWLIICVLHIRNVFDDSGGIQAKRLYNFTKCNETEVKKALNEQ